MLQRWVASIFSTYLGKYIKDLDKHDLQVSMWNGEVVLTDMELVPEALDAFDLPIIIDRGFIGRLRIEIPWKEFYVKTCKVHVEDVEIVAQPLKATPWNTDYERQKRKVRKQNRLHVFEATRSSQAAAKTAADDAVPDESEGFYARLGRQIIANLQVTLKKVLIRYEDACTDPRRPVVMTMKLDECSAVPCDAAWRNVEETPKGSQANATSRQFRICSLSGLTVAIDHLPMAPRLTGPSKITALKRWKEVISASAKVRSQAVLPTPVEVTLKITQQPSALLDLSQPRNTVDAAISCVSVSLKRWQYDAINRTARYVADFATLDKFRQFKPTSASPKDNPKAWWVYAYSCVALVNCESRQRTQLDWGRIRHRNTLKQQYVALYKRSQKVDWARHEALSAAEEAELVGLEDKLDVDDIIYFRRLVYFQLSMRKEELAAKGEASPATPRPQAAESGGWLWGWLGYSAEASKDAPHSDPGDPAGNDLEQALRARSALTPQQKQRLYQELGIHDDAGEHNAPGSPASGASQDTPSNSAATQPPPAPVPVEPKGYVQTLIQLTVTTCIVEMSDSGKPPVTALEALQQMGIEADAKVRHRVADVSATELMSFSASHVLDHGIDPADLALYKTAFGANALKAISTTHTFASVQLTELAGRYSDLPGSWNVTVGLQDVELSSSSSVTGSLFPSVLRKNSDATHLVLATVAHEQDDEGGRKYLVDVHLHPLDLVIDVTWLQTVFAFWGVGVYGSVTELEAPVKTSAEPIDNAAGAPDATLPAVDPPKAPATSPPKPCLSEKDLDPTAELRMALERATKVDVSVVLEQPCLIIPHDCTDLDSVALVVNAESVTITSNHGATAGRRGRVEARANHPRDYYNHYRVKSDYGRLLYTTVRQWTEMAYRDYDTYTKPILRDTMLDFELLVSLVPRISHISRVLVLGQLRNLVVRLSRRGLYTVERALTNVIDFASNLSGKGSAKVRRAEGEGEDSGTATFAMIRGPMAPELVQAIGSDPVRHFAEVDMVKGHLLFYDREHSSKVAIIVDLSSGTFELNEGELALMVVINREYSLWIQLPTQAMHSRWLRAIRQIHAGRLLPPTLPDPGLTDPAMRTKVNLEWLRMPIAMGDLRIVLEEDDGSGVAEMLFSGCQISLNSRRYDTKLEINSRALTVTAGVAGDRCPILWTFDHDTKPSPRGFASSTSDSGSAHSGHPPDQGFSLYFMSHGEGSPYHAPLDPKQSKAHLGIATKSLGLELNTALCEVTEQIWDFVNIMFRLVHYPEVFAAVDVAAAAPHTPPEVPKPFDQPQGFRFLLEVNGEVEIGGRNETNDLVIKLGGDDLFLMFHDTPYGIAVEGSLKKPLVEDCSRPSSMKWLRFVRGIDDDSRLDFSYANLQNRGALKSDPKPARPTAYGGYAFTHRLLLNLVKSEVAYFQTSLWELLEYFMTGVATRLSFVGWRGVYDGAVVDAPYERYDRMAPVAEPYYDLLQFAIECADCIMVLPPDREAELGVLRGAVDDVGVANHLHTTDDGDIVLETLIAINGFACEVPEELSDEVPQGLLFRDPVALTLSTRKALINPRQRLPDTCLTLSIPGPCMMVMTDDVYCAFLQWLTENLMEPYQPRYPYMPPGPPAYEKEVDALRYNHFTWQFRIPDLSLVWVARSVPLYTLAAGLAMDIRWYVNDDFEEDILLHNLSVCAGVDQADKVLRFDPPIDPSAPCLSIYIKWITPEEPGARRLQHLVYDVPTTLDFLLDDAVLVGLVDSILGHRAARCGGFRLFGWVEPDTGWPAPGEPWPPSPPPEHVIRHTVRAPVGMTIMIPSVATVSFSGGSDHLLQYTWCPDGGTEVEALVPSLHVSDFLRRKMVTTDGGDALRLHLIANAALQAGQTGGWNEIAMTVGEIRVIATVDSLSAIYRWARSPSYKQLAHIWAPSPQLREAAITCEKGDVADDDVEAARSRSPSQRSRSPLGTPAPGGISMGRKLSMSTMDDDDLLLGAYLVEQDDTAPPKGPDTIHPAEVAPLFPRMDIRWTRPKLEILCSKRLHRGFQIDFGDLRVVTLPVEVGASDAEQPRAQKGSPRSPTHNAPLSSAPAELQPGDVAQTVEVHLHDLAIRNVFEGSCILEPARGVTKVTQSRSQDGLCKYTTHVTCDDVSSRLEFSDVRTLAAVANDYAEAITAAKQKPAKAKPKEATVSSSPRANALVQSPRAKKHGRRTDELAPAPEPEPGPLQRFSSTHGRGLPKPASVYSAYSLGYRPPPIDTASGSGSGSLGGLDDYAEMQFAFDFPSISITFKSGECAPDDLPLLHLHEPKVDSAISLVNTSGVCIKWHSGVTELAIRFDRFAVSSPLGDLVDVQEARLDWKAGSVHPSVGLGSSFGDSPTRGSRSFAPAVSFALGSGGMAGVALTNPGLSFAGMPSFTGMPDLARDLSREDKAPVACQTIDLQLGTVRVFVLPQVAFAMMNFVYLPYAAASMPDTFASSDVLEIEDDLDLTQDLILHRDRKLHVSGRYQNLIRINGNLHELHLIGDKPLIRIDAGVTLHIVNAKLFLYNKELSECVTADDGAYIHATMPEGKSIEKGVPLLPTSQQPNGKDEHDSSRLRIGAKFALSIMLPDSQENPRLGVEISCEADGESDTTTTGTVTAPKTKSSASFNLCSMTIVGGKQINTPNRTRGHSVAPAHLERTETEEELAEPTEILAPIERVTLRQKAETQRCEYDVSSTGVHMRVGSADAALLRSAASSLQRVLDSIGTQAKFKIARDDDLIISDAVAAAAQRKQRATTTVTTTSASVKLGTIDILVVEDSQGFDLPLFFAQINEVALAIGSEVGGAKGKEKSYAKVESLEVALDYYNLEVCEWQSVFSKGIRVLKPSAYKWGAREVRIEEDAKRQGDVKAAEKGRVLFEELNVTLSPIGVIVTPQFIKTLSDAKKFSAALTTSSSAEGQAKAAIRQASSTEFRQYEVVNHTGFPLDVALADSATDRATLQNTKSWHFNFGKKYGKDLLHALTLGISGEEGAKESIVIGRIGTSEFRVHHEGKRIRLFCSVTLTVTGRKKVFLRSRVTLQNELPIALDVTVGDQKLTVAPGDPVSIPHNSLNHSNMELVPHFDNGMEYRPAQLGIAPGLFHKLHRAVFTVSSRPKKAPKHQDPARIAPALRPQVFTCVADIDAQTGTCGDTKITVLPIFSMENLTGLTLSYKLYTWDGQEERRSGLGKIFGRKAQVDYDLVAEGRLGTDDQVDFTEADPFQFMYLDITVVQPTGREMKRAGKHSMPFLVRGQTKNHQGRCTYITLADDRGRQCHLNLEYSARKVAVSCPLWIINQTTFFVELAVHNPLKLGQSESQSSLTAGQTLGEGIKPGARPFLMAPEPPDKDHHLGHLYCRIVGNTAQQWKEGWSTKIDVSEVGIVGTFECPPSREGELPKTMAYCVEFPWGKVATRTRVIRLTPRWIVLNRTPKPIDVRHEVKTAKGLPGGQRPRSEFDIPPLSMHQEYHGGDDGNLIAVRNQVVDGADVGDQSRASRSKPSLYCRPFSIDKTGDIDFTLKYLIAASEQSPSQQLAAARKLRAASIFEGLAQTPREHEEFDVVRASVFRRGCITYVTIDPLKNPPIVLENRTPFRLFARQRLPDNHVLAREREKGGRTRGEVQDSMTLHFPPRTSKAFAWYFQHGAKKLLIAESREVLEKIKDNTGVYPASGVLEVDMDVVSTSNKNFDELKRHMIVIIGGEKRFLHLRVRHRNGTTRISLTTDTEIDSTFSVPRVAYSTRLTLQEASALLCATDMTEVAHLCIRDVLLRTNRRRQPGSDVVVDSDYSLSVTRIQLDDQRATAEHPVVVVNKIPQSQNPFLMVRCKQKIASCSAAIHIQDCAVVLQPLVIKIHDKFLFQLLEFYNAAYEKVVVSGRAVARKYYTTPDTFVGTPATQEDLAQRPVYLEKFAIDAIDLTAWLVRSAQDSEKDFFKRLLGNYALFVRGFEDLPLIWPRVAMDQHCSKAWLIGTVLSDRYMAVARKHVYRVAPGVASVHTFVTDLLATLPTKNSEPMKKYQTPRERIRKPAPRPSVTVRAPSDTSSQGGTWNATLASSKTGIPHLVADLDGSVPPASETGSLPGLPGDYSELDRSVGEEGFVDVMNNSMLKSVGYYGETNPTTSQESYADTNSPVIGRTRAEVVKGLKKRNLERSHPSYGRTSWVEYAQVLGWNDFKQHTTDTEFRNYAHLALDAYIRQHIADPNWMMEPYNCRCEQVKALAENLPYGLEPPSKPSSKQIKLTWWEFAHHTTWDEFRRLTTEQEFKQHAHMARDACMGRTVGFRKIDKREFVPMFTM